LSFVKLQVQKQKLKEVVHHGGTSLFFFLVIGKEAQAHTYALNARNAKNLR
jgi:hypothetical protein